MAVARIKEIEFCDFDPRLQEMELQKLVLVDLKLPASALWFEPPTIVRSGMFDQGILKGKYHCTIDLLFDWFGLVSFANKNKKCQLSYS